MKHHNFVMPVMENEDDIQRLLHLFKSNMKTCTMTISAPKTNV